MDQILRAIRSIIPKRMFAIMQPAYHFLLAFLGAIRYGFPSRKIVVIGITGTKGKTSTVEYVNAILEASGKKTAVLGTLRFKIGDEDRRNLYKMTMPGRFFVQKFLHDAVANGCTHAVIEMTSEGAKQFRQRFIAMDALIFTNLSPEHIESHGSFEKYRDAKLAIARTLARSSKQQKYMIANADNEHGIHFLSVTGVTPVPFSINDADAVNYLSRGVEFSWKDHSFHINFPGEFSLYNALAALTLGERLGISPDGMAKGLRDLTTIPGRAEEIEQGQGFRVVVDYAHTADSLTEIYRAYPEHDRVCVLGSTGGGRDKWKRPVMGRVADGFCDAIILTNEDPYDENPHAIIRDVASGITTHKPTIELDRRVAIREALNLAEEKTMSGKAPVAVIITGKGTDPYIMGPKGTKTEWDDRQVVREELSRMGHNKG